MNRLFILGLPFQVVGEKYARMTIEQRLFHYEKVLGFPSGTVAPAAKSLLSVSRRQVSEILPPGGVSYPCLITSLNPLPPQMIPLRNSYCSEIVTDAPNSSCSCY